VPCLDSIRSPKKQIRPRLSCIFLSADRMPARRQSCTRSLRDELEDLTDCSQTSKSTTMRGLEAQKTCP